MLGISARDLCATIRTMCNWSYSHSHSHSHCPRKARSQQAPSRYEAGSPDRRHRPQGLYNPPRCAISLRSYAGVSGARVRSPCAPTTVSCTLTCTRSFFCSVTLSTLLLGLAKMPLCQNVRSPTRKRLPACQTAVFSKPHEVKACAADGHLGTLWAPFSAAPRHGAPV